MQKKSKLLAFAIGFAIIGVILIAVGLGFKTPGPAPEKTAAPKTETEEPVKKGGTLIVYEAQTETATTSEMEMVINVLRRRLDFLGFSEATVSRQGDKKVRVMLPGFQNPEEAVQTLGQTAKLTFRDADGNVVLEGTDIANAAAVFGQIDEVSGNQHYVKLQLTKTGREKFTKATAVAATRGNGENYISIMLDEAEISRPTVRETINSTECIISGGFVDASDTQELTSLINSGNLPFSIKAVEVSQITP